MTARYSAIRNQRNRRLQRVVICSPSGNVTTLVLDKVPILPEDRSSFNQSLIDAANKVLGSELVEQCGILTPPRSPTAIARVEMLGGEFCGNATRSAVFVSTNGEDGIGTIECSGAIDPLDYRITDRVVHLAMPLPRVPQSPQALHQPDGLLVALDGIAHLVQFGDFDTLDSPQEVLRQLRSNAKYEPRIQSFPTLGVSQYSPSQKEARFCVWVKAVHTVFDETACGSGTSAIGIASAYQQIIHPRPKSSPTREVRLEVRQPSGQIIETHARVDRLGTPEYSAISGGVDILYDGPLGL